MMCGDRIMRSRGYTLIELMVTLVISSFLVLGAITFLASAHKANLVQSALSGLGVSGRFGLDQIARDIRMSGYRDSDWMVGALTNAITAIDGLSTAGGDSLAVLYEGARDCTYALAPGGTVTNTYQVTNGVFECNGQPITRGVQEMQVYFGEDTDNDRVANRWLSPGTAGLDLSRVVSVRIHLLVSTDGNDISSGPQSYYFDRAVQAAVDDGQIRREYSVTVAMRNPT